MDTTDANASDSPFCPIEEALEAIRRGEMVVVCDSPDRENEGDLCMAAELVTPEMIKQAEWIAGITFSDAERAGVARSLDRSLRSFDELRKVDVGYDVPPALTFFPTPPRPAAEPSDPRHSGEVS